MQSFVHEIELLTQQVNSLVPSVLENTTNQFPKLLENVSARILQAPAFNTGDTAWMLFSTALVLFMTMPGK